MEHQNTDALKLVLRDYYTPDPKIVGKLPRKTKAGGTVHLDFVSHSDVTRILLEIDPHWRWVPIAWDNGRPAIHVENGIATMWGELTILGQARLGVGSVPADKPDLDKELVGDFLRNAAMRFGICLSLWSKSEWDDDHAAPSPAKKVVSSNSGGAAKVVDKEDPNAPLAKQKLVDFAKACGKADLDHEQVADHAGVDLSKATNDDLVKLRAAFVELKAAKNG